MEYLSFRANAQERVKRRGPRRLPKVEERLGEARSAIEVPKPDDPLRGKRIRLSSKNPLFYSYNKSARGKGYLRASHAVEGRSPNYYRLFCKDTPLFKPLGPAELAPFFSGRMRELEAGTPGERAHLIELPWIPRASRPRAWMDRQGRESDWTPCEGGTVNRASWPMEQPDAPQHILRQSSPDQPRGEGIVPLHPRHSHERPAQGEPGAASQEPAPAMHVENLRLPRYAGCAIEIAGGGGAPSFRFPPEAAAHPALMNGPAASGPAPLQQAPRQEPARMPPPTPSDEEQLCPASSISCVPMSVAASAISLARSIAAAPLIQHERPAEAPVTKDASVLRRGPGYISSAHRKIVQLKVARADAQPPGDNI